MHSMEPTGSNGHGPSYTSPRQELARRRRSHLADYLILLLSHLPHLPAASAVCQPDGLLLPNHPRGNWSMTGEPRQSSLNRGNTARLLGLRRGPCCTQSVTSCSL